MSKLVDKERLAKLAKALDERAKAAVKAENERAVAAEEAIEAKADANAQAIEAINHAETGILKQAKDYADGEVNKEKERAVEQEGLLAGRLEALEGKFTEDGSVASQIKAAVDVEKARAEGEEAAIRSEFAAVDTTIRSEMATMKSDLQKEIDDDVKVVSDALADQMDADVEGSLANLIADEVARADAEEKRIVGLVESEVSRAQGVESGFETRIAANEAFVAAQPAKDKEQSDRISVIEEMMGLGGETGGKSALDEIKEDIEAAQAAADKAQSEVDAVEQRLDSKDGLVDRIKSLETFKNDTYPAAEAKVREDFAAADAQVLADAKKYADEEITKLVDSAPDAMNTLNELAEAIKGNEDIYKAYVQEHAQAMTKMKEDLQKEIDDDVKDVVNAQKLVNDAQKLVNDAQAETNEDFEGRIAANEAFVAAQPAIDEEQDRRLSALEDANKENGAVAVAIKAAKDAADAAQADVDAIEGRLDNEGGLVDRLEAVEAFKNAHSHATMEQGIADNKAAIEKEAKDRQTAITTALEAYSTTEQMKTVIGNVVNSLALTMENDQVVLKLGGVDGIALASVDLDLATDTDIDTIIAGLDVVEGK